MSSTNGENPTFESAEPLPDRPGANPERDDQLGYAPFAKNLAQAIARITPTDGLVLALYGPWGSGKSTVLNFVESYLDREKGSGGLKVIRFNPWWFASRDDLFRSFFDQLLGQLPASYILGLATYAERGLGPLVQALVSLTDKSSGRLSIWTKIYLFASRSWQAFRSSNVADLKTKIGRKLQAASNKILVIVDDIDRLSGSEVREVFRLIKSVGDFPNVTYLLAFDREAVCRMLEPVQGGTGEEYLGKIIQIPFELGTPDQASLHQMLFRRLNAILAVTPEPLFDKDRWQTLFLEGVGRIPKTPRDVVRFTNALSLTYGPVRDEVNAVDFIAIEAIRVFLPQAYDVIRRNPGMFCDPSWRSIARPSDENTKNFHDSWFATLTGQGSIKEEHREPLREMLCMLFPRVDKVWSQPLSRRTRNENSAAKRFIRDPDAFPVYFALAVPETSTSRAEMIAFLSLDEDAMTTSFVARSREKRSDGISRARTIMEVLPAFMRDLPSGQSGILVTALIRAGDELLSAERFKGNFFPPQPWLFSGALKAALRNVPASDRIAVLSSAIQKSTSISAIAWTVEVLGHEHGKYGENENREREPLVAEEEVSHLERETLQKIRGAAQSGALLSAATLPNTLVNWQRWAGNGEVRDWILAVVQNPKMLARMLESILSEVAINGHIVLRIDPEGLRRFVDPSLLVDGVRRLAGESWLKENEKIAADAFIQAYEARENGQDPDPF